MNQFITLPSGLRVNTAHILEYRPDKDDSKKVRIWQAIHGEDQVPITWTEDMTAEQLDALLSPPSSPIVEHMASQEAMEHQKPFRFKLDDEWRHGIIDGYGWDNGAFARVLCDGKYYRCRLGSQVITLDI